MTHNKRGWIPDKPDIRDLKYTGKSMLGLVGSLPTHIDFRDKMPPIQDQGDLGSCTGWSAAAAVTYNRIIDGQTPMFWPSVLYIYYNTRLLEGTLNYDAGAEIRNAIRATKKYGFCPDTLWPYDQKAFKKKPPLKAYKHASMYQSSYYYRINNAKIDNLRACLSEGFPFVFGFTCYTNLIEADTNGGIIPMPGPNDSQDGGHAVVCCGYDDEKKLFVIHNSWGTEVADKGYYYMPYDYMTNTDLCEDFWTIRDIKETDNI